MRRGAKKLSFLNNLDQNTVETLHPSDPGRGLIAENAIVENSVSGAGGVGASSDEEGKTAGVGASSDEEGGRLC
jgi:hypothetical protein